MMAMIVEVWPAPLGPSSASTDPAGTSMLRSSTARIAPYPQLNFSSRNMLAPLAEIGLANGGVRHHAVRRAVGDDFSLIEDEEAAAYAHHLRQIVLDQHGRDALGVDPCDDIHLLRRLAVVQPRQRLVQKNEDRLDRQCARNLEALEL